MSDRLPRVHDIGALRSCGPPVDQALQSVPRSRAQAAVIAAIGLVRRAVDLRLEPVKDGAYDRRADRIQMFLGPPYSVEIGISGADDQDDRINDAGEEKRIIRCQDRGRVQKNHAERLRN